MFDFKGRWLNEQLSLLENAKDSMRHGIAHYLQTNPSATDFKQAIINIHRGFELALKEALRRRHPAFVVAKFDLETIEALISGRSPIPEGSSADTLRTVTFDEAVERSRRLLGLEDGPREFLYGLNKLRRAAVHYSFAADQATLERLLGPNLIPTLKEVFSRLLDEHDFLPSRQSKHSRESRGTSRIQSQSTSTASLVMQSGFGRS